MDTFDVGDENSWYFGPISRQEALDILMNERDSGVFLVRDSQSITGDYVLCVREDIKVSNYIINKMQQQDQSYFRIGDQSFDSIPQLLTFYTLHYLDTTPLRRPATKKIEKVIGKFDFEGSDHDDLPFRRGEILTIVRKDEDQWWTAKNARGQVGQIPVPYIQKCNENMIEHSCSVGNAWEGTQTAQTSSQSVKVLTKSDLNRKLPAYARVKQARVPNAYDKTALKLEEGDVILVTKTNINGQWEGESRGKKGFFPFTHVEFIDDSDKTNQISGIKINSTNSVKNNDWGE